MTRRHILHLIKGLGAGGAEQLLLTAVPYLDRTRFQYEVGYLLPWKDALVRPLQQAGITVHCLEGGQGIGWLGRLRRLVRERDVDLVHCHSPVPAVGARLVLRRGGKTRIVYTEHNVWERYHRLTYWANVFTYPRNEHVLAVSEHVRDSVRYPAFVRWRRMPPVEAVYHGVDPAAVQVVDRADVVRAEFGIPPDAPLVGTVANFKAHKGYQYLLRAAVLVRRQIPDVRFVLVGQGPHEQEMRRLAETLGLDGTVVFGGYREDVLRVVASFDLFALPSIHEGLSIALIEAMASGKPVVVTTAGGLPEVVEHGRQGFLVPPKDERALAESIITLLNDPSLRSRLGEEARRRAQDFSIEKAARRMEEIYEEVLR